MDYEKYKIKASTSRLKFEFFSIGPKGRIKKQVSFKSFPNAPKVFNIGFGDVDETGTINDFVISGNNDSQKILATVSLAIIKFFESYPSCYVYATGSTESRTRLYRIGISNNFEEISKTFVVMGFRNNKWMDFERGEKYDAFLVYLK